MSSNTNLSRWLEIAPELTSVARKAYAHASLVPVFPARTHVFKALESLAPSDVRVVILGQDPYHSADRFGTPKAHGLSFGYNPEYVGDIRSSMYNICMQLQAEYPEADPKDFDLSLEKWANQGVLLLNTCLTVEQDNPLSHVNMGWQAPILKILQHLAGMDSEIAWLAWGAHARFKIQLADVPLNRCVFTSHPCNASASRGTHDAQAFLGSYCFRKINLILANRKEIKWA